MSIRTAATIGFCAFVGFANFAFAGTITTNDLPDGTNNVIVISDGITVNVTTSGGDFVSVTGAANGTGVAGGARNGEIDGSEFILFSFDQPVIISEMSLAFLFMAGAHGDAENERAEFISEAGSFEFGVLSATTAFWDGFGFWANNSPADATGAGAWTIFGPDLFGQPITSLKWMSGNPGSTSADSDYIFRYVDFNPIPAPGALALLGVAALMTWSRRR